MRRSDKGGGVRFSIVMPVLNGMPWLPEAIRSITDQQGSPDVELIVLDGGSTDGSREWLAEHLGGALLVFEPDDGQTDALIRGFELATGEVLAWLNADDLYEPTALRDVVAAFDRNPKAVGVSGGCLLIDAGGSANAPIRRVEGTSLEELLATNINLPQPATFFRREAYRAVGGLDPRRTMAMDVDLWMKLASIGTIELIPQTLARFRIRPGAKTQLDAPRALKEDWSIRRRFGMPMFSRVSRTILAQAYWRPLKRRWQGRWRRLLERRQGAKA